jgi:hypothetical protein
MAPSALSFLGPEGIDFTAALNSSKLFWTFGVTRIVMLLAMVFPLDFIF